MKNINIPENAESMTGIRVLKEGLPCYSMCYPLMTSTCLGYLSGSPLKWLNFMIFSDFKMTYPNCTQRKKSYCEVRYLQRFLIFYLLVLISESSNHFFLGISFSAFSMLVFNSRIFEIYWPNNWPIGQLFYY